MVKDNTSIKIKHELEESRKSEALLASLLENSSQPFGVGYPDGRLGLVNKAFEDLTGYSREELKSTDWSEILTPHKFRDMENEKLEELQRTGQPVRYEKEYIRKDGTRVPIELLVHIVKNKDGTPEYYYSFITDISERKHAEQKKQKLLEKEQQLTEELKVSNEELQSTTEELQVTNEELHQQEDKLLQTYNKLKESEERFRSIIENIQDAYMRADKEGTIIMASPSAARMYRFNSIQEMIGTSTPSYFRNSEDRDFAIEKLKKHGKFNDYEVEAKRNDGTFFWVSQNAQYYYDDQGKIQGSETIVRDITKRKKFEESLRESGERLRLAQTSGNVGIWDWNTITNELNFTPELEQLYGLSPGTIKTYNDWRQLTHPEDIEKIEVERNEKIANQEPFDLEFRIFHKSGEIRWLSAKGGAIYNDEGDILRVLGINTDITQRKKAEESLKESEERYHSLFDNNHAVMLLINPDNGDIIDANPAATHFYGYNYDELVKMNINNINVLSEEEINDKMQKSVSFQQNNFLFKHQLASGEIRDVDVYSGTIVLGGKKLLYSIIHDVTDRVIAQDKLKESNEDLERFAYVSSHDLQEPLRMVTSFTQLIERRYKGRLDDDADDYIGFIVDGAKRMKLLIDDLLMFSRLNTQPKENELVNLETVLDTVLLNLQVSIEENNIQITHDPLPTIYGDLSRKVQVFQNLISNAIKFNDKKIIKIHISAKKEGNEWIFSVSDNGIGMDPKHLERIFTIFQRLHTREEYEGTGIGLAIIQKIIQQQNGRIWVESELGKGSTFYFTLPIKQIPK